MLDSHEWGVEKPDPRLFQIALEQSRRRRRRARRTSATSSTSTSQARARPGCAKACCSMPPGCIPDVDCRRVASLAELVELLKTLRLAVLAGGCQLSAFG